MAGAAGSKPHVVCVPFPMQGHVIPMLKLAKLLHHKGFHVTFVNTNFNHQRILDARGAGALDGLPDFQFGTIPLEVPPSESHGSVALSFIAIREACRKSFLNLFRDLVTKLNDNASSSTNPPVTCFVSDAILPHTLGLSVELGIPNVLFWNIGAQGFMSYKHSRDQMKELITFLKDPRNEGTDPSFDVSGVLDWIPMKGATLKDLLSLIQIKDKDKYMADFSEGDLEKASKASAVIFHTFQALESQALNEASPLFRRVYSIGPLQMLLDQISNEYYDSVECNLWNEEPECIRWLDSKEPKSVIYVNFGSTTVMSVEQLVELAWGLADSNHNFLWITRPDMIMGEKAVLPQEFVLETKERGYVASWCPQEQVLNHTSVAGFLTHNGWNSTLETISSGIPTICWPFFGDHYVNCRRSCNDWGIGMELSDNFHREEVESLVKELMTGEKGKMMKEKAMEWKKMAEEAVSPGGPSSLNLDILVNDVLLSKSF